MDSTTAGRFWEDNAETWTRLVRAGHDLYRDRLNTPAFLALLPPVAGLCGLDIGCGEGANTRAVARLGAIMTAVDIAPTFVARAAAVPEEGTSAIVFRVADACALPFGDASFDFATAFMSLMDVADLSRALAEAARVLRPGGFLQFSILHPCFAPPYRRVLRNDDGTTRAVELARYFDRTDGDIEEWTFSSLTPEERETNRRFRVPLFHRTLADWVGMLVAAGLRIEAMAEPSATEEEARAEPGIEDTRVVPLFLHIRVRKPG